MNRTPIACIPALPEALRPFAEGASLFDSSCSEAARVWFTNLDGGCYIKTAPKTTLKSEAEMNAFFHSRGFGPEVLAYISQDEDWLVTRAVPGEDCIHPEYLDDPKRLSVLLGQILRQLHETDPSGCPVTNLNETAYPHIPDYSVRYPALLTSRVLLHGDYCLPNIILKNWKFSGFIDLGGGGIGDRHLDLYWGCWSILYNLKEERWCTRFLDAYGRECIDTDTLRTLNILENPV